MEIKFVHFNQLEYYRPCKNFPKNPLLLELEAQGWRFATVEEILNSGAQLTHPGRIIVSFVVTHWQAGGYLKPVIHRWSTVVFQADGSTKISLTPLFEWPSTMVIMLVR